MDRTVDSAMDWTADSHGLDSQLAHDLVYGFTQAHDYRLTKDCTAGSRMHSRATRLSAESTDSNGVDRDRQTYPNPPATRSR